MRLLAPLLFSLCFFGSYSRAQIDANNINKQLLEHEIKILVDSTRRANGLNSLFNDSILYVASNHHAEYLLQKGALSHTEPENASYVTPQDRAKTYGAPASYLVGENVVYANYNAKVRVKGRYFTTNNYRELARCLVYSWIRSKGHFANMINPDYQVTGLTISVDPKTQRVYAVQKFAQVLYKYNFEENHDFFPYSRLSSDSLNQLLVEEQKNVPYPFGLKYDDKEDCDACKENWEQYPTISVRIARNNFILRIEEAEFVQELIQNRRDGFAVELVPFAPYANGNSAYQNEPSRRNGAKRTNGRILEPVYRKDLMKGFKRRKRKKQLKFVDYLLNADSVAFFKRFSKYKLVNFDAQYFEIKLGKVPKDMSSWWNHNLIFIRKKQLCHFVYLTNYPGELDLELLDVPYHPPVPIDNYEFNLEHFSDSVTLYYDPGKSQASGDELKRLIKLYNDKGVRIADLDIKGFCSVEGKAVENEALHKDRAGNILNELKPFLRDETSIASESNVDWEHFYRATTENNQWAFLAERSKKEVQQYFADFKNPRPKAILQEERRVEVVIKGVRDFSQKTAMYYIQRDLVKLFYKDSRGKIVCIDNDSLERLYEKAYFLMLEDTISTESFLSITIPEHQGMSHRIMHDMAFYRYHLLKDSVGKSELRKLSSKVESVFNLCGAAEHLSPQFHYLSACLLVDRISTQKTDRLVNDPNIEKAFSRLNLLLNWYDLDSNFMVDVAKANLNIVNTLCERIDPDKLFEYNETVNRSLIQIVQYYRRNGSLTPERIVSLGKFLCYFQNIPLAIDLCKDFLDDNEVLKLYLPLAYTHSSFLSSDREKSFEQEYHALLLEAKDRLTAKEWCSLFYGKYGIPFQIMDYEKLHTEFCNTCPERINDVLQEAIQD